METSRLICSANQWTSFYMITAFVMKELKDLIVYYHQIRPVSKYSEFFHIICTFHNRSISVRKLIISVKNSS